MNGVSIFSIDEAKHSNLAILGTACFVCSKIPDELLRCQDCKRISYCGAACRDADSESHEKICLALQVAPKSTSASLRRMVFGRGDTPYDLEPDIFLLFESEEKAMKTMLEKEQLTSVQRDLLLYEPRCAVCLRSADDVRSTLDPQYTSLLYCPHCRAAFACTEDHRAEYLDEHCHRLEDGETLTECEMNKRAYEHSLEIFTRGWTSMETLWFPMRRISEYAPLPSSWDEWFADPSNLCPPDSSPALNRVRTKQLSIPMTILYGMEQFDKAAGDLPLLSSRTELEIAVIGALQYEIMFGGLACFEELVHNLPNVRRLVVRLIGPQIIFGMISTKGVNRAVFDAWDPCALCKEKGVELVYTLHPALFHGYVGERTVQAAEDDGPPFQWPDIAVVFNSGMGLNQGERSHWSPTLEMLAKNNVPTLCTSFLEREAEEDEDYLNMHQCNIVIKRHKNPWRSEAVTKMVFMRKGFFTYNGFVQGFRGWREKEEEGRRSKYVSSMDDKQFFDMLEKVMAASRQFRLGK